MARLPQLGPERAPLTHRGSRSGCATHAGSEPAASRGGENYGWRVVEGLPCFNPDPCDPTGLVLPVVEYDHSSGRLYAVTDIDRLSRDPTTIPVQPAR